MKAKEAVLDTNILLAGLYSTSGASYALLDMVTSNKLIPCISVPLVLEYEAVLSRDAKRLGMTKADMRIFLGYLISRSKRADIHYLWRPALRDAGDDMVLEVAVGSGANAIITHNIRDFHAADRFGVDCMTPGAFLKKYGGTR